MTFLVYKKFYLKKDIYYQSSVEENGEYLMKKEELEILNKENDINSNKEELTCVPKQFFFSLKKYRDYVINNVFKLNSLEGARITVANEVIKKQTENYENLNYLLKSKKIDENNKPNNEIKKLDFGQNMINIDKDFKLFFSINNINTVTLKGVTFTRASNTSSVLRKEEGQTIIN